MQPPSLQIEICYARAAEARVLVATLKPGATVADALDHAACSVLFAGVNLGDAPVGIFGRIVGREQILQQGDRVEIYRPLAADPRTARSRRLANRSGRS